MAYTPPKIEMASTVVPQKPYKGIVAPVLTTLSTIEGTAK